MSTLDPDRAHRRRDAVALAAIAAVVAACGIGSGRSTAAYCDRAEDELDELEQKYRDRAADLEDADGLAGVVLALTTIVEAQGDIVLLFRKLADVAPEEIRVDVEAIAEELDEQADNAGDAVSDPLGTLAGGLLGALQVQGALTRVAEFTDDNCDIRL